MSNENINNRVNELFVPLETQLNDMKTILYQEEMDSNMLMNGKNMLNAILSKLNTTQENVKSTLEHIDNIMSTSSSSGGKKHKKHKKKTRKNRRK